VKKLPPGPPRGLLQVPAAARGRCGMEWQGHLACDSSHEFLVRFGICASKFVINVSDSSNPDFQLPQDVQEAHRVRPARRRHDHTIAHASARRQHVVTGNGRGYLLQHNFMLPSRDMLPRRYRDFEGRGNYPVLEMLQDLKSTLTLSAGIAEASCLGLLSNRSDS
jgi:hypothetical protein